MANSSITQLTNYTNPQSTDVLPIVDVGAITTKKITLDTLGTFLASQSETITNKTFNTAGTGNSFSINGTAVLSVTGTGSVVVLSTSPTLVTPTLGVATVTSVNKLTITAPATSATLTVADGKTLTASNTLTFTGTDGSTLNIGTGGTLGTGAYATIASYATLASPTFTGTPVAPLAAAATNTTQLATTSFVQQEKIGYTFQVGQTQFSPVDATTYYFGMYNGNTNSTTEGQNRVYIPKAGTVTAIYIYINNVGVGGTSETSTFSFRLNATTDTTISSSITTGSVSNAFSNTSMSVAVVAGDFFELKWVTPTWVTNPTNIRVMAIVYIQ